MEKLLERPIFFNRNRVWRVYKGGQLLGEMLGEAEKDGNYPEEWIASDVKAENPQNNLENEGLSIVEGTNITLRELIAAYPGQVLGQRKNLGILVKYLDSAVRLPLQAHPDKAFSRRYFNSEYGKTEMWIVLKTRKDASICFGFQKELTEKEFSELIERSETEENIMEGYLNRVPVKPGDVFLIPAKSVHAIGAGCCILEIQEPTDFTIQPEYWCAGYRLSSQEMYMNLDKEEAIKCFDFSVFGEGCVEKARKIPVMEKETADWRKEVLVGEKDTECFRVNRYTVHESMVLPEGPGIYIIMGNGYVKGTGYERKVAEGDYFLMPYSAAGKYRIEASEGNDMEVFECLPPKG